jgi:hypothetical protein
MASSQVPAVITYLVTTFTSAGTLGQANPAVNVIDGPMVTADPGPLALWVGVDDITTENPSAATSAQERAGIGADLGGQHRTENLSIHCTAQAQGGSNDVPGLRAMAAGITSAVEDLIRADPRLGGLAKLTTPGVNGMEWRQGPAATPYAMAVRVSFTIDAQAQI